MERTNPARSAGPDGGARPFGFFWGDCQKKLAQQGETTRPGNSPIAISTRPAIYTALPPVIPRAALPMQVAVSFQSTILFAKA